MRRAERIRRPSGSRAGAAVSQHGDRRAEPAEGPAPAPSPVVAGADHDQMRGTIRRDRRSSRWVQEPASRQVRGSAGIAGDEPVAITKRRAFHRIFPRRRRQSLRAGETRLAVDDAHAKAGEPRGRNRSVQSLRSRPLHVVAHLARNRLPDRPAPMPKVAALAQRLLRGLAAASSAFEGHAAAIETLAAHLALLDQGRRARRMPPRRRRPTIRRRPAPMMQRSGSEGRSAIAAPPVSQRSGRQPRLRGFEAPHQGAAPGAAHASSASGHHQVRRCRPCEY